MDGDLSTCWEPSSSVTAGEYEGLSREDRGEVYYFARDDHGREMRVSPVAYRASSPDRRRTEYHSRSTNGWHLDIDLGRVVPARRVVLRFDPRKHAFREVRLLGSPFSSRREPYKLLARAENARQQRVLDMDLLPPGEDGYVQLHRLRIAVTDSRLHRYEVVSQDAFEALSPEDQGAVDYFVFDALGGERRTDAESYYRVEPERQGRRRFHRRERPCLSEVEVWIQGDNVALGIGNTGGTVGLPGSFDVDSGFDGIYDTYFVQRVWRPESQSDPERWILTVDLGAAYPLNHLRLIEMCCRRDELVLMHGSDGSRDPTGELKWRELLRSQSTLDYSASGDVEIATALSPERPLRYLRSVIQTDFADPIFRTRELQLFGEGYAVDAALTSPLIELPQGVVVDRLTWEADVPGEAATVTVRSRFGSNLRSQSSYYTVAGYPTSREDHQALPRAFRGPIVTQDVPGSGWTPWTEVRRSGDQVAAPGPRKYMQLEVRLQTADADTTPAIRALGVTLRPPVVREALAEIWPDSVDDGRPGHFDVYVRGLLTERSSDAVRSTSFDQIRVDAGSMERVQLAEIQVGPRYLSEVNPGLFIGEASDDTAWVTESSHGKAKTVNVRLARPVEAVVGGARIYHRRIRTTDEVPVDEDGRLLQEATYLKLADSERGREMYLARVVDNEGVSRLDSVSRLTWLGLSPTGRDGVRYFRRVSSGEFAYDRTGSPLSRERYEALPAGERGAVVAEAEVVRLRLLGTVVRYGTVVTVEVSHSQLGVWQRVDPGDATDLAPGTSLTIRVPLQREVLRLVEIAPQTVTPNGDGVNDVAVIQFIVGNATVARRFRAQIVDLSGRQVRLLMNEGTGSASLRWDGRDDRGRIVAPGLYLCRIGVEADAPGALETTAVRSVAVAY